MNVPQLATGAAHIWWVATAVCALAALVVAGYAKTRKQDLLATYLGDLLVLFIVFDIANPNPRALGFSILGAAVKAIMTLLRARKEKT